MARIAINGLGRIGKLVARSLLDLQDDSIELVLVNEPVGLIEQHALWLEFDTVHGKWTADINTNVDGFCINGRNIRRTQEFDQTKIGLNNEKIDVVIDCTGKFKTEADLKPYFEQGVKKVLVSAPVKEDQALNVVYGINHTDYLPSQHNIITAASCTTNCLAPIVKVIHEEIGIAHGSITTLHNVTNTQEIVDKPARDTRRARSALNSLIPTTTGSATAISLIYPELKGRLNGHAVRVPLLNASITDCVFEVVRETTVEEVNRCLESWSVGKLNGVLGYETRPLVSADYVNDTRSAIIDAPSTMVINNTQVKLYAWYDNEFGYACRVVDILRYLCKQDWY